MRLWALALCSACRLHFDPISTGDGGPGNGDGGIDGAPLVSPHVISASNLGVCAALEDGSLWCWGDNASHAFTGDPVFQKATRVAPGQTWIDVATSGEHTCARTQDGALWCWGTGTTGQLGNGAMTDSTSPVQVGTATDWTAITVGYAMSCGLRGGALYCWGANYYGQLGDGTGMTQVSPAQVMAGTTFTAVAAYREHACAIASDGALYCWGLGTEGQLGVGTAFQTNPTPLRVGTSTWRAITTGDYMTCGIRSDGTLWCWGSFLDTMPIQVGTDSDWTAVVAGDDASPNTFHVCGLRASGLWCAGTSARGVLGNASDIRDIPMAAPAQIDAGHTFATLAASEFTTCGARDGAVACTGLGASGQLGDGTARVALAPRAVAGTWSHVDTGAGFVTAIASDGSLWAWGNDTDGEVPTVQFHAAMSPAPVSGATPPWQRVEASNLGALAIDSSGALWRTGAQYQQPGVWSSYTSPLQVGAASWSAIDGGAWHDCGIQTDQSLWCWGANTAGELGNASMATSSAAPVHIDGVATYDAVSAGEEASCGIRTTGALYCWGNNVGNGGSSPQSVPTVVGSATWSSVAAGHYVSCGIQTDQSLWCWGYQVGDGTINTLLSPEHIGTATWKQVSTSDNHACGVQADGSLWCWGSNRAGQLGDGTRTDRLAPARVGASNDWLEVHAGYEFSCALTTGGQLSCWGTDHDGALGGDLAWTTTFAPIAQGTSL